MDWDGTLFAISMISLVLGWSACYFKFKSRYSHRPAVDPLYFKGINYLLNEKPDKALDVFINTLEVTPETMDTYLGLGGLFRRRGESDRAIRIHKHLLSKSKTAGLTRNQQEHAQLELAYDYLSAGLLDRAEDLLLELVELGGRKRKKALEHLVLIYEQLKEWPKALAYGEMLLKADGAGILTPLANYCCELAEVAMAQGDQGTARLHVKKALQFDRNCVRASIIYTNIELAADNSKSAFKAFARILHQDPSWLSQLLPLAKRVYEHAESDYWSFVEQSLKQSPQMNLALALARSKPTRSEADQYLRHYLIQHPSWVGFAEYLAYVYEDRPAPIHLDPELTELLFQLLNHWIQERSQFICQRCGFKTKQNQWQCPSCKRWNQTVPIDDQTSMEMC